MILQNKEGRMTLEELEKQTAEQLGQNWRISVRLQSDGHTQIRTTRKTR